MRQRASACSFRRVPRPQPLPEYPLALADLEPLVTAIREWATARSFSLSEGILELEDAFPQITVVGFAAEDLTLFLTLAAALTRPVLVLTVPPFSSEDLRLEKSLAADLRNAADVRYYAKVIDEAKTYVGMIHDITAYAFAPDLTRAVVFRASADWAEPIFSLLGRVSEAQ